MFFICLKVFGTRAKNKFLKIDGSIKTVRIDANRKNLFTLLNLLESGIYRTGAFSRRTGGRHSSPRDRQVHNWRPEGSNEFFYLGGLGGALL